MIKKHLKAQPENQRNRFTQGNKFNVCKDHRNKKEVPDPIIKDLISDKIWKRNKSKADLTVENCKTLKKKGRAFRNIGFKYTQFSTVKSALLLFRLHREEFHSVL